MTFEEQMWNKWKDAGDDNEENESEQETKEVGRLDITEWFKLQEKNN